jgi:hypothetical protein
MFFATIRRASVLSLMRAAGRTDKRSRILSNIKKWLVEGYWLSESIKRGYPRCPGYALAMIAAAERIDQLPLAVESLEADMIARARERRKLRPVHPFYPVILMLFVFFMVWVTAIALVGVIMFVLTTSANDLQFQSNSAYLQAVERNRCARMSLLCWCRLPPRVILLSVQNLELFDDNRSGGVAARPGRQEELLLTEHSPAVRSPIENFGLSCRLRPLFSAELLPKHHLRSGQAQKRLIASST